MSDITGNGNGVKTFKAWMFLPLAGVLLSIVVYIFTSSLSRVEATQQQVDSLKQEMATVKQQVEMGREVTAVTTRRLERIEDKIDRLLEQRNH